MLTLFKKERGQQRESFKLKSVQRLGKNVAKQISPTKINMST